MTDYSKISNLLDKIASELSEPISYKKVYHKANHEMPMPSVKKLKEIMNLLESILFPGYFGLAEAIPENMKYYIGASLDKVMKLLTREVQKGFCFSCGEGEKADCVLCGEKAKDVVSRFIAKLPEIREMLSKDVQAAFDGDPAAKNHGEVIFCYPSIMALVHHRIAHEFYKLEVSVIPRIISEMAHSETGIDIHPGATISEGFFIDHGTGTVIGETCIIGKNVSIYQGVTLGAKSFPKDEMGNPIKGIARHPIVEDNVTIYAGATVLGRVTIGKNAVIGGNVWITHDIPKNAKVFQAQEEVKIIEK